MASLSSRLLLPFNELSVSNPVKIGLRMESGEIELTNPIPGDYVWLTIWRMAFFSASCEVSLVVAEREGPSWNETSIENT